MAIFFATRCLIVEQTAHTRMCMGIWKRIWQYISGQYRQLSEKKYTTLAGTLVFFLLMSLVPMLFWATLLLGKLQVETTVFALPGMEQFSEIFEYIRREAQNATSGASVFLLITSLYSATTLFYQMRKSGEIIYGTSSLSGGLQTRLGALALLFLMMSLIALTLMGFTSVSFFLGSLFGEGWEAPVRYILLLLLAFLLVFFLNLYICPYPAPPKCFWLGSLLTVAAWAVSLLGFTVYLRLGNLDRLYGALSAVIVFLLWLYVMTICFISGVIFNSQKVESMRKNNRRVYDF